MWTGSRKCLGSEFHVAGPATEKDRRPYKLSRVCQKKEKKIIVNKFYVCFVCEGGQLSQSAHFALQLPYVMFGLGQTPNFVEEVGVGIPNNLDDPKVCFSLCLIFICPIAIA